MSNIGEDGVRLLGLQGGYLTYPAPLANNPSATIANDPNGQFTTPFWLFRGESYVPTVQSMETDLTSYINGRLHECLDFSSIQTQFDVKMKSSPRLKVTVAAEDVNIFLDYTVESREKATQKTIDIDTFDVRLPVNLKRMYQTGLNLLRHEKEDLFLENASLNLFTADPAIPFTDMRVDCGSQSWETDTIKDEMIATLAANVPRIRIKGAKHAPFERPIEEYLEATAFSTDDILAGKYPKSTPPDLYEYTHLYWDPHLGDVPFEIKVLYEQSWGMDFEAKPSKGGRLKTTKIPMSNKFLDFLCLNLNHFTYSVQYPVIVKLQQPEAFEGRGFVFQYAMPVVIKENKASREPLEISPFIGATYDRNFCDDLGDQIQTIEVRGLKEGYLNVPLNNANVSMRCVRSLCPLGITAPTGAGTYLRARLPQGCLYPTFIASKEGFLQGEVQENDNDGFVDIDLVALHKVEIKPVVYVYQSVGNVFSGTQFMDADSRLVVRMSSPRHDLSVVYPNENHSMVTAQIALEDTTYEVYAVLFRGDEPIGGYQGQFKLDLAKGIDAENLMLPVIDYRPTPATDEDRTAMLKYISTGNYQEVAKIELQ